jgi:hypothetical protein
VLRSREDGLRVGAAGLGLGLATGIAGLLSASIGFLAAGISVAAAAGAMLLVQVFSASALPAGFTGALTIGISTALFAAGTLLLAELRWYALPLLLLVPSPHAAGTPARAADRRAAVLAGYALIGQRSPSSRRGSPPADRCSIDPNRRRLPCRNASPPSPCRSSVRCHRSAG